MKLIACFLFFALTAVALIQPTLAANKCATLKGRCAVEVGGTCDERTGRWQVGNYPGRPAGGKVQAFIACLDRERAKQNKLH
jgi:hypothetical protein